MCFTVLAWFDVNTSLHWRILILDSLGLPGDSFTNEVKVVAYLGNELVQRFIVHVYRAFAASQTQFQHCVSLHLLHRLR